MDVSLYFATFLLNKALEYILKETLTKVFFYNVYTL